MCVCVYATKYLILHTNVCKETLYIQLTSQTRETSPLPPPLNKIKLPFPTPPLWEPLACSLYLWKDPHFAVSSSCLSTSSLWCNHSKAFPVLSPYHLHPNWSLVLSHWSFPALNLLWLCLHCKTHTFSSLFPTSLSPSLNIYFSCQLRAAPSCSLHTLLMSTEKQQGTGGRTRVGSHVWIQSLASPNCCHHL